MEDIGRGPTAPFRKEFLMLTSIIVVRDARMLNTTWKIGIITMESSVFSQQEHSQLSRLRQLLRICAVFIGYHLTWQITLRLLLVMT